MSLRGKTIVVCDAAGDVPSVVVGGARRVIAGREDCAVVTLAVNDADTDDSSDAVPLTTALLLPSQAIKLARALLVAAGVKPGPLEGNARAWRLNDFGV